jgi:hypothetical protein
MAAPATATPELRAAARTLRDRIEPLVGQVYFSPEAHGAYEALGFGPSSMTVAGVAMPDPAAYVTSRGSLLGQVPGEVVAAAFAVFNPAFIAPGVARGWTLTDADTIYAARLAGAVAQLRRVLGEAPEGLDRAVELLRRATEPLEPAGKPLFAGLTARPWPGDAWGDLFHAGDRLREFRGDAHTAAWTAAGLDAVEIGLLTEHFWGLPARTYIRSRAWSDDQLDAGEARLRARGWLDGGGALTGAGRAAREEIEAATDAPMAPAIAVLGADRDELFARLEPWGAAVVAAGGYPAAASDIMSGRHAR